MKKMNLSKTKLAIAVFCVAFGVNLLAFVFSKKTFLIEETKTVWLFELPPSMSPLDSYSARGIGPHSGAIGTLFMPTQGSQDQDILQSMLTDQWSWDEKARRLTARLREGLTYTDGTPILAEHWVDSIRWVQSQALNLAVLPEWQAFTRMEVAAPSSQQLTLTLSSVPPGFQFIWFVQNVLSHPLSGVIHPSNLQKLKENQKITKDWISSGPYRVRKWKPKEIILVSRDDFPVRMNEQFFRTLRFQSAPIKNPACDFIYANSDDVKTLDSGKLKAKDKDLYEHSVTPLADEATIFWMCRSWKEPGSFCSDPANRQGLAQALSSGAPGFAGSASGGSSQLLSGKTLKVRIPEGSDAFRAQFKKDLQEKVTRAGGQVEEVSFFFKESKDADLELGFVVAPVSGVSKDFPAQAIRLSSRLGGGAWAEANVVGEVARIPLMLLMKRMDSGDPFRKVFLEPDIDEKKLPL